MSTTTTPFHDGWSVDDGVREVPVRLPHDAMIGGRRSPDAPSRYHGAWFEGGRWTYRKRWTPAPALAGRRVSLVFEGVQRTSEVLLDGVRLGGARNGYTEFEVELTAALRPGSEQLLEVVADASDLPNGRWYSGAGIYRPVRLRVTGETRIARDGVKPQTVLGEGRTTLFLTVDLEGLEGLEGVGAAELTARVLDAGRLVGGARTPVTSARVVLEIDVAGARLWSAEDPALHDVVLDLARAGTPLDSLTFRTGLRVVELDVERGLLVNGVPTKLRGGNVHHDSGILGAATHRTAEFRRARILKAAGYNALRSAHNPMSRDLLDACDEVGLLVVDEYTDVWWNPKTTHDDSRNFLDDWPGDVAGMVRKDRTHPSVIAYSIGNENGETGSPVGVALAARMRAAVHALDGTRPVTAGINLSLTAGAAAAARRQGVQPNSAPTPTSGGHPPLDSTLFNVLFSRLGPLMDLAVRLPGVDRGIRPVLDVLDVAGYNYGVPRYEEDLRRHPHRFIVGSETLPGDIARVWPLVERNPRLLGDFSWAAWDHLGEVGIGVWTYERFGRFTKPYPHLVSGAGAIDITGHPGAQVALSRAAWGLDTAPALAVRPVQHSGRPVSRTAWRSTDAVASWAWRGCEGRIAEVEVFSSDDEVELHLNGRSLGRRPAGVGAGFTTRYRVPYEPGELRAVGFRNGREQGWSRLVSAAPELQLRLVPDRTHLQAGGDELAFVDVLVCDADGTVEMLADTGIEVTVEGAGTLVAFGASAPATEEGFSGPAHRSYQGRALAVVRAARGRGDVTIHARASGLGPAVHRVLGVG